MQIKPELTASLRSLLLQTDALQADRDVEAQKAAAAAAALARLRRQISDFDDKLAQLAGARIPVERDRLSQIIAGQAVSQPERDDVEDRAAQVRHLTAQRAQSAEDCKALDLHVNALNVAVAGLDQKLADFNAAFYRGLADAVLDAYRRNAVAFIAENAPALWSAVRRLRDVTGEGPDWEARVMSPGWLVVKWREDEETQETQWSEKIHKVVEVWPRRDDHLVSGEPIISDAIVDDLVRRIRSQATPS